MAKIHSVSFFAIDRSDNTKNEYKRTEFKNMMADFFLRVKIKGFTQQSKDISSEDMEFIENNPVSAYSYCVNLFNEDKKESQLFSTYEGKVNVGEVYYHIKNSKDYEYVKVLAISKDINNTNIVSVVYEVIKGKEIGEVYNAPFDRFVAPIDESRFPYAKKMHIKKEYTLCGDF